MKPFLRITYYGINIKYSLFLRIAMEKNLLLWLKAINIHFMEHNFIPKRMSLVHIILEEKKFVVEYMFLDIFQNFLLMNRKKIKIKLQKK